MEPPLQSQGPQLFYRLGLTREQHILKDHRNTYSGICIRANYIAYFQKYSLTLLLDLDKPFFIDPMTYIFSRKPQQIQTSSGDLKLSYKKLAELYGDPILSKAGVASINHEDFADAEVRNQFINRVISFQYEQSMALPEKYSRYQVFVEAQSLKPVFLLPPYFYIDQMNDGWLELNLTLALESAEIVKEPVYPVIFLSRKIARQDNAISEIVNRYRQPQFGGFFIWIEDLSGVYGDAESLTAYRNLVSALSEEGKPIYSLYGDYFSLLLWYEGLTGYCSGICYSERKEIDPGAIRGSIPDRYYVRRCRCKYRLDTTIARAELNSYERLKCDCGICPPDMNVIELERDSTQEHFMIVRADEIVEVGLRSRAEIVEEFKEVHEEFEGNPLLKTAHLIKWVKVLK